MNKMQMTITKEKKLQQHGDFVLSFVLTAY